MEFFRSSSPPIASSPTLLSEDWRKVPPMENKDYLQYIDSYHPDKKDVEHLRVLLYGPSGSGKSSFINSVETALRGRTTGQVLAGFGQNSFTIKPGNFYPFVFNDIMGLEKDSNRGICVEDIKLAMKGHVKDGYVFNYTPLKSTDPHYNSEPSVNEQTHVLVCVVSANTLTIMSDGLMQKMKEVRLAARHLVIVLTWSLLPQLH